MCAAQVRAQRRKQLPSLWSAQVSGEGWYQVLGDLSSNPVLRIPITVLSKAAAVPLPQLSLDAVPEAFNPHIPAPVSSEFSLSPGWVTQSSLSFPTKDWGGWRADRLLLCSSSENIPDFLLTVTFCLCVGLEASLYDYKDQLTAEKQVLWWFYLSVPKWHFIQNINYLAHCFPDKYLF